MVQLTLTTGTSTSEEEPVKVPIFIYEDGAEATTLAKLIVDVKPTYLLNLSNSIDSLKNHVKRNVLNNIVYIMDIEKASEVKSDYDLLKRVKFIDLFRIWLQC